MRLNNADLKVGDILLDPFNPRFEDTYRTSDQEHLKTRILNMKDAKELMSSMGLGVKWVNRIVVRQINTLSDIERKMLGDATNLNGKYVVVEGNTRLACLKSGKIEGFSDNTEIPVLIAARDDGETVEHYETELKITQGIANVMVVKQWSDISKARHLYELCKAKLAQSGGLKLPRIINDLSKELAMTTTEVRKAIYRYSFYKEINEISDTLEKNHWGYLEAFDRTDDTRSFFGMVTDQLDFEWNIEEEEDGDSERFQQSEGKQELFKEIPSIIKGAVSDGLNSKDFRDAVKVIIDTNRKDLEEVKDTLIRLTDTERSTNWNTIRNKDQQQQSESDEERWQRQLSGIYKELNNFSPTADWALSLHNDLLNIQNKVNELLKIVGGKKQQMSGN